MQDINDTLMPFDIALLIDCLNAVNELTAVFSPINNYKGAVLTPSLQSGVGLGADLNRFIFLQTKT